MSATVWKYELKTTDQQIISMPQGARPLHVGEQRGQICLWALVDPDPSLSMEERRIAIVGTGHVAPEFATAPYLGTVSMYGGSLVFHVFVERTKDHTK